MGDVVQIPPGIPTVQKFVFVSGFIKYKTRGLQPPTMHRRELVKSKWVDQSENARRVYIEKHYGLQTLRGNN